MEGRGVVSHTEGITIERSEGPASTSDCGKGGKCEKKGSQDATCTSISWGRLGSGRKFCRNGELSYRNLKERGTEYDRAKGNKRGKGPALTAECSREMNSLGSDSGVQEARGSSKTGYTHRRPIQPQNEKRKTS